MWDVMQNRRVRFGPGVAAEAGGVLADLGASRVLLLAFSQDAPCVRKAAQSLEAAGLPALLDASIAGEPRTGDIDRIAAAATEAGCDAVLAIGGGSVLDAAKAVAMLCVNGGQAAEYQTGARTIDGRALPLVAIPTTAGTGSEATKVSVLYNPETRLKKSIYSPYMIADTVLLDPEATLDLPRGVTVSTGADALSHAIESYVSLNANAYSETFSLRAMTLVHKSLARCVSHPDDLEARGEMLLASYFGGVALCAGIGLAHIIAQPLGGLLKIPHGEACAIYLPHAMTYNLAHATDKYCDIARVFGAQGENGPALAEEGIRRVEAFLGAMGAPTSIRPFLPAAFTAEEALPVIQAATGHIACNPRPVTQEAIWETIEKTL